MDSKPSGMDHFQTAGEPMCRWTLLSLNFPLPSHQIHTTMGSLRRTKCKTSVLLTKKQLYWEDASRVLYVHTASINPFVTASPGARDVSLWTDRAFSPSVQRREQEGKSLVVHSFTEEKPEGFSFTFQFQFPTGVCHTSLPFIKLFPQLISESPVGVKVHNRAEHQGGILRSPVLVKVQRTSATFTATMGENAHADQVKENLLQLKCHFTWTLLFEDIDIPDLEMRISEEVEFLDIMSTVGMHNLLAYVRHLKGQNEGALQSLKEAEALIQGESLGKRILVTWGNCAWVYYHMGSLTEAQTYLDKVENICKAFASPFRYRMECAEMHCEEGWALLKCGGRNYRRAMESFTKALKAEPENPKYNTGYAVAAYREDFDDNNISLEPLRKAVRLNPADPYIKVYLALKLQDVGETEEAERHIEEALSSTACRTYVFRYAAKYYRRKGCIDKALQLLHKALQTSPDSGYLHYQIGLCYKQQMIQLKTSRNTLSKRQGSIKELAQRAISKFQKTVELRPTFEVAYVCMAEVQAEIRQYKEAEANFQIALNMQNLRGHIKQDIHFRYGRYQLFHQKSEDEAITYYLKGLKIEETSYTWKKLLTALEKVAERRVQQNVRPVESTSLLGLVHKLKGNMPEALLYYEMALRLTGEMNPEF